MFQIIGYKVITDTRCVPGSCTRSNSSEKFFDEFNACKVASFGF